METIKKYVADNLPVLCAETVEFRYKKCFMGDDGHHLRELAHMVHEYMGQDCDGLALADRLVSTAAMEALVRREGAK